MRLSRKVVRGISHRLEAALIALWAISRLRLSRACGPVCLTGPQALDAFGHVVHRYALLTPLDLAKRA